MTDTNKTADDEKESNFNINTDDWDAPGEVILERNFPITPIDIESEKDMMGGRYHPLRGLQKWFAARPTPAVRFAILGSILPSDTPDEEVLSLMQLGPEEYVDDISEYIESKYNQERGSGTVDDHYGYQNPNQRSPAKTEIEDLHETVKGEWDGELPTVYDPTAGRGITPFEAMRYELPVVSNELNPIPYLINKVALEYAPKVGSIEHEFTEWRDKIHEEAKSNIQEYYPTEEPDREILNCANTYIISCDSCGGDIPLVLKWWLNKTTAGGDAIRPHYNDGEVEYEHVKVEDTGDGYDPNDGPVDRGDAECPHCGVVTETADIRAKIREGEFEYSIYGVDYQLRNGDHHFRAGGDVDERGMEMAKERVESDIDLFDFFSTPVPEGKKTNEILNYGIEQWRDYFTPRQLIGHYEYIQAYKKYKPDIEAEHDEDTAMLIKLLLSISHNRTVQYSTRGSTWRFDSGSSHDLFTGNNFALKKIFSDNNISTDRMGYISRSKNVLESYKSLCECVNQSLYNYDLKVLNGDASKIKLENRTSVSIIDPPYYDTIMYSELSDIFYIISNEYFEDELGGIFDGEFGNKNDEIVANSTRQSNPDEFYEQKMEDMFNSVSESMVEGGVVCVMFTHTDMQAWNTLTSAFTNSDFIITATHPIKTEKGDRVASQGKATADTSIFLVGRKVSDNDGSVTLWSDVKDELERNCQQAVRELVASDYSTSKTDMAIVAYGEALEVYSKAQPIVDNHGDAVEPAQAIRLAREVATRALADEYMATGDIDQLDSLTRWYILSWLTHDSDRFPYDSGNQLGMATDVDIDDVKRPTKIWRKKSGDVILQDHGYRVMDIAQLRSPDVDDPNDPVDPTSTTFEYAIDVVHAAMHVYESDGADEALMWMQQRNLKHHSEFDITVSALLDVLPADNHMTDVLWNMVSGETGSYLDIDTDSLENESESKEDITEY